MTIVRQRVGNDPVAQSVCESAVAIQMHVSVAGMAEAMRDVAKTLEDTRAGRASDQTQTHEVARAKAKAVLEDIGRLPLGLSQATVGYVSELGALAVSLVKVTTILSKAGQADEAFRAEMVESVLGDMDSWGNDGTLDTFESYVAALRDTHEAAMRGDLSALESIRVLGDLGLAPTEESRVDGVVPDGVPPEASLADVMAELDRLVGLTPVKSQISGISNLLRVQQRRAALDLKAVTANRHMVFVGSPGTGKTTVARIVGQIFRQLGVLESGHLIEVARDDLVAGYVGQTGPKTDAVIDSAIGGVLFIDEAYSLTPENPSNDFGREAIETLVKRMEDDRDHFVVIVAGYQDEMERFLSSNPGLKSRFDEVIEFPDYSPEELLRIFKIFADSAGYTLSPEASTVASEAFAAAWAARDRSFGNARMARNYFEDALVRHANRLADVEHADAAALSTLLEVDMPEVAS